jgi:hypothetical protein
VYLFQDNQVDRDTILFSGFCLLSCVPIKEKRSEEIQTEMVKIIEHFLPFFCASPSSFSIKSADKHHIDFYV